MSKIPSTILVICISIGGICIIPLVMFVNRNVVVTQEMVDLIVEETVTTVANTGILSQTEYQNLKSKLNATGRQFDIEVEIYVMDDNKGKKISQANYIKIGENVYYIKYQKQVEDELSTTNGKMLLKEGDKIYISAKSYSSLNESIFNFANSNEYTIFSSKLGMVTKNGE